MPSPLAKFLQPWIAKVRFRRILNRINHAWVAGGWGSYLKTRRALQRREATNRALLQAIPDLFIQLDRQGNYLRILNPGQIQLFDSVTVRPGNSVFDVLPPALAHQRMAYVRAALETRQPQSYEYELEVNGIIQYEEARITACDDDTALVIVRDISERKRSENQRKAAELALQQSEARYRAIVEDQTELICRSLPDTTIVFVNDAYCRYFGLQREDIIGRPFLLMVHAEDQADIVQLLQSLNGANPTVTTENRVIVNGQVRWMQWIDRALCNDQGIITEIQAVGRDITELKHVEAALQESNTRFRELAETVQEGFFVFETTTAQYSYLNPACVAISGFPTHPSTEDQPHTRGMTHWINNIHPDDRDRVEQALQKERQGYNFDQEYRFMRPDGALRWLRSKAFPIRDKTGTVIRIVGTVEDITERKQLELALQESEERFRKAFDDSPIGMSLVSSTGQFLRANTQYCKLVGYTEAELLTMNFEALTHPDDLAADREGVRQMLAGQIQVFQMEKRYFTKQGTPIPVLMQTAPIRDQSGQILYFVGHIQDIRERLQVERMKDEFISVVSHELRTPLTSIRGSLGILESGVFDTRPDEANQMLKIALNNSDRLVRLVNDILDLERLQSGKVQLVMQECQVSDLLQQAINSVQAIADQATITLNVTAPTTTLRAAPDAIVQTLTNLLSNAIKFSSPGSTVWLTAEVNSTGETERQTAHVRSTLSPSPLLASSPAASDDPDILFSVRDRGRGIPANKLDIIFEQFQQVDISDAHRKGGTGLGLAICRSIVQQHGGHIWVESILGEGSTFYFTIPSTRSLAAPPRPPVPVAPVPQSP
ncbi:MAG: PAS domain S-box protein [Leptolyngbyaceae cyanobacterium bins.349]|nr:PAS domain S-box protein [Leptolyngbyaceae cyanobacterium bins.349]